MFAQRDNNDGPEADRTAHALFAAMFQLDPADHAEDCPLYNPGSGLARPQHILFVVSGQEDTDVVLREDDERFQHFLRTQRRHMNSRWS